MKIPASGSRSWLWTLGGTIFIAAYVLAILVPNQKSIASMRRELKEKRQFLANADLQAATQSGIDKQLEFARQQVDQWRAHSPKDRNMITLLGKLAAVASQTGVTLHKLSPQEPTALAAVRQHTLNIEMVGDFSQLVAFLTQVEELPETIWLQNVNMSPADKDGKTVQCALTLSVFADNRDKSG